jgi:hypothetical protein
MPFFPTDQDWTLITRPSRVPLAERFPTTFAVNRLPSTSTRGTNPRRGNNQMGKPKAENPNFIHLPLNVRFGTREPGELADDGEGIPEWAREPLYIDSEPKKHNGDVTLQSDGWT